MGMKKNKLFEKEIQNGRLKKTEFFKNTNSQYIFVKISASLHHLGVESDNLIILDFFKYIHWHN